MEVTKVVSPKSLKDNRKYYFSDGSSLVELRYTGFYYDKSLDKGHYLKQRAAIRRFLNKSVIDRKKLIE